MSKREPFLAFIRGADDIAAVKEFAAAKKFPDHLIFEGGIPEACEFLKQHPSPEILMVEIPSAAEASGLLDQLANVVDPTTKVAIVGTVNEYSFFTWLTDIGIAHYFLKPLKLEALNTGYAKISAPVAAAPVEDKKLGKVVGLVGSKGGVGATSIAIVLAGMVAKKSNASVALIDLNPQDGSISTLLDLEPCRGVQEALEKPDRIDELLLDRLLTRADERFYILSAEETLAVDPRTHPDAPAGLLNALRKKYDVIIVDTSMQLNSFTKQCLQLMDEIVIVSDLTLLGLRGAMRLFDWMEEGLKGKPIKLVTNKEGLFDKHEVSEGDVTKSVKHPIDVNISSAPGIFMEIANGLKVLDKTDVPALDAVSKLAKLLFPEHMVNETEGESQPHKKSFMAKLKKK